MKIFFIILDGCSHFAFEEASTPFLDKRAAIKVRAQSVIPSATYTGHASLMTGTFAERHGIVGNQFYDRTNEKAINFDHVDPNTCLETPTIFEFLQDRPSAAICEPISKGATEIRTMSEIHKSPGEKRNELVFKETMELMKQPEMELFVVNFSGIDYMGENFGENSLEYSQAITEADGYLNQIYDACDGEALFLVTADHGLTCGAITINLDQILPEVGYEDVISLATHRACHVYAKPEQIKDLGEVLLAIGGIEEVWTKDSLEPFHLTHQRSGDLVAFAAFGHEFSENELSGSHGGLDLLETRVPIIFFSKDYKLGLKLDNSRIEMSIIDILPCLYGILRKKAPAAFQGLSFLI